MTLRSAALLLPLAVAGCVATAPMPPASAPDAMGPTPTALDDPELVQRYQATITPGELAGLLYTYADDYMAGRDTGTPGQRFAADFLAGQYAAMGIAPRGSDADVGNYGLAPYKQTFDLVGDRTTRATLRATGPDGALFTSEAGASFDGTSFLSSGSAQTVGAARVVFGGFGVQTEQYDDVSPLADRDLRGAWLVLLGGDPTGPDGRSLATEDGTVSPWGANDFRKASALMRRGNQQHGLAGIVIVSSDAVAVADGAATRAQRVENLGLDSGEGSGSGFTFPPVFAVTPDVADALLAPSGQTVRQLREAVQDGVAPRVFELEGLRLAADIEKERGKVETENVVAFIEGSDPELRDEVVVVSAHLDHIGEGGDGEDTVYNGADDDGSGTVTVLEIAEAFQMAKEMGHGPRRSVLFLHVTGEERGLLGSAHYTDVDPRFPIENTVANLNIDMIGRYDPERGFDTKDYVYVIGGDLISQDIADWNAAVNDATGTDLLLSDRFNSPDDPNQFFRRSDHWNFGKHDVPFIFYFTGTHEDYHGVGDSADKIDYDRMARIGRLIFGTAWEIANRDERPAVSGIGFN